ncbi:MAG: rRNA maturation RNase YbeY [Crocinitomicaceae bacterium]
MDDINFNIEKVSIPDFNPEFFRLWISHIVMELDRKIGEISYIFCTNEYILGINKQYLKHDYYTDIITFDYTEGLVLGGDIFISVETVLENANEYSEGDFSLELNRVIIHGVLHLCGYNDKSDVDQKKMTEMENWALEEMLRFT